MVTVDFGAIGPIDMRDMVNVWSKVFGGSGFSKAFDEQNNFANSLRYQLSTNDSLSGIGPGSGPAAWFFGHDFAYNLLGQPSGGTVNEISVFSTQDVNNGYKTHQVDIFCLQTLINSGMQPALGVVESKNLDLLIAGDSLKIFGNSYNDYLIGSNQSDQLFGRGGKDTLDGGAGADRMAGGAGDDNYIVENADDILTETANSGIDSVVSSVSRSLEDNIENLTLTGAAILGTGNGLANSITGNDNANTLYGGAGNDRLDGEPESIR